MKPHTCQGCPLETKGYGFVPVAGSCRNGVMLVGEAPGEREAQLAQPFVGPAGMQLQRTLELTSAERGGFAITNTCLCRPPNNWLEKAPWEHGAILHCQPHLIETVNRLKPRVVMPMGNIALRSILGYRGIEKFRGYVYDSMMGGHMFNVVPTYHPAFLLRGKQNLTAVQASDIRRALKVAEEGYVAPDLDIVVDPNLGDVVHAMHRDGSDVMAMDIETPSSGGAEEDEYGDITDSEIIRISFSWREGEGITVPWRKGSIPLINELVKGWKWVVFWNADFDVPRLLAQGVKFEDNILDAMWLWHWMQSDLPRGLGYAASLLTELREWKSLSGTEPERYSAIDAAATIECFRKMEEQAVKQGRFEGFIRHYVKLQPRVNVMARRGVLVDPAAREEFRGEIQRELHAIDGEIQKVVPVEVRPFKVRRQVPPTAALGEPVRGDDDGWVWDCNGDGEWGERQRFLYGSPKQIISYIKFQGHEVPYNRREGRDTTDADALEKLAKKVPDDPLYPLIIGAREFKKVMGTYIEGYEPGPDGRVRTTFGRKPSTWRFSSESPNVQNVIKRGRLAKAYRKQFVASPQHVLVELDYRAIEAVLTGYFAGDEEYIRAARLGVHSLLASHILGNPIRLAGAEGEIRRAAAEIKGNHPGLYAAAKMTVHMSNYGGSARKLRIEHPDLFFTTAEAQKLQDTYFNTIAVKVREWQRQTLRAAHFPPHCLTNPFGYRHYFWDVFHGWGERQEWGTDAKRALAFLPQSTAAGVMSRAIERVSETEVWPYVRWMIHDSLLCEMPADLGLKYRIMEVVRCMEEPIEELGGLRFEVEVNVGKNWGEMHEWRIE